MLTLINSSYFKDLLESFSYGVVIFNAKEQAYAVNTMATRVLGLSATECVGKGPRELLGGMENYEAITAMLRSCRQGDDCPKPVDTRLNLPDGNTLHLSLASSLLIENNKIFGILISMHDNTHIFQLHEREKRIIEQNTQLQQERADSVLQLSRAMAHQIRNPVMSIGGFAKLLQRKVGQDTELEEFAEAILEGSQRLEGMVKAFTRFTGIRPGAIEDVDLSVLLEAALETARKLAQDHQPEVAVQAVGEDVTCVASVDPGLVLQAVELLVANSIEAGAQRVWLRIMTCQQASALGEDTKQGQSRCCLDILDDGPGIAEDDLPFLFDPFFSTKPEASGMGLCTAQRIAQELGGSLGVVNRDEERGVLARLRLPRV